jgi:DNA-binding GntR family transcriptional regulator
MPPRRYAALAQQLADEIAKGEYAGGVRFPTEHDLKKRFGVGRHTVREALKALREQGLVTRRRKVGTTVLMERPTSHYSHSLWDLNGLLAFAGDTVLDIRYEGFVTVSGVKVFGFDDSPNRWLRIAGLRSRRSTGQPLCWSEVFIPTQFVREREVLRQHDRSIYERVMEQNSLRLEYVEQEIKAAVIPGSLAQSLEVESQSAALLVARRYVSHTGVTFEVTQNLYPSDRYSVRSLIRHRS